MTQTDGIRKTPLPEVSEDEVESESLNPDSIHLALRPSVAAKCLTRQTAPGEALFGDQWLELPIHTPR